MSKAPLQDISHVRGMSEPFFFSFNTFEGGAMLAHGVLFTSFYVTDECRMQIGDLESDPRFTHFMKFLKAVTSKSRRMKTFDLFSGWFDN